MTKLCTNCKNKKTCIYSEKPISRKKVNTEYEDREINGETKRVKLTTTDFATNCITEKHTKIEVVD